MATKEEPNAKSTKVLRTFVVPEYGVSVEAENATEAVEKAKRLKENK
jgi:hypothetical protein